MPTSSRWHLPVFAFVLGALAFWPAHATASPISITVSGTITSGNGQPDSALVFGSPIESLFGTSYTATFTTDPDLDSIFIETATNHTAYGGTNYGPASPFALSVTVNGVTHQTTENQPFWNRTYLQSLVVPNFMDQIDQEVESNGCAIGNGPCVTAFLNAYSLVTPFLTSLDFNQRLSVTAGQLDPNSNFSFTFRDGPTTFGSVNTFTGFTGTVSEVSIKPVPEPASVVLTGMGSVLAFIRFRRRCPASKG